MMKKTKRILILIISIMLMAGLSACGSENKRVFSIQGETLSYKEVAAFGLVYVKEHNILDKDMLAEQYEGKKTYGDYYIEQFEADIVEALLLSKEAKKQKVKLSNEDNQKVKDNAEALAEECGKDFLEGLKVGISDLEKIYELKLLGDTYIKSISEGETLENEGEETSKQTDENMNRYIKVYQVTFQTAEVDENGMVKSDQDGNVIQIPQSDIVKKKQEAEEFAEKVAIGANMESLVKNYDSRVTGMEQYYKYKDLTPEYKKAVDNLKVGEVSSVISSTYGYYVIKLLDTDAKDLSEALSQHENRVGEQERMDAELERLYDMYIGNNTAYKDQELWEEFQMQQFIK